MKKFYRNWTAHNLIGHPLMGLCLLVKLEKLGHWFHDKTLPPHSHPDNTFQ